MYKRQPEDYANAARKAMAEGYTAVKVDPVGFNMKGNWMEWSNYGLLEYDQLKVAVDRVAAIREAGGPGLDIIIELHSLTDTNTAIQLGRELEKYLSLIHILEITESVLIQSMDRAAEALENLRKAGIHIALDDFGVGYSSLNYLSNLPVDIIKIDRSLTQQILTSPKQYALLKLSLIHI